MNTAQRIAKNTAALFFAQIVSSILSMILGILIARSLGDQIFGTYSFALALIGIFIVFAELGYNTVLIREIAKEKSLVKYYLDNILGIRILFLSIIFILLIVFVNIYKYTADLQFVIYSFGIYLSISSVSSFLKGTFRAYQIMEYESYITTSAIVVKFVLGVVVLYLKFDLLFLAYAFILSSVFEFFLTLFFLAKNSIIPKIQFNPKFLRITIVSAISLSMISIFNWIFTRIDILMLSSMRGDAVVGWYSAAMNLVQGFKPLPTLFVNVMFPVMAQFFVTSKDSLQIVYEKSFYYLFVLGLPLGVGLSLLSDKIILFFYGTPYLPSAIALQILAWETVLFFLYSPLGGLLIVLSKEKLMTVITGLTAVINIVLNLLLIPGYSYVGAAIATIASELVLLILYIVVLGRNGYLLNKYKNYAKIIAASLVMAAFIIFFTTLNLFVAIVLAMIVYFTVFYLMGGLSAEDISIVRQIINKQKT